MTSPFYAGDIIFVAEDAFTAKIRHEPKKFLTLDLKLTPIYSDIPRVLSLWGEGARAKDARDNGNLFSLIKF